MTQIVHNSRTIKKMIEATPNGTGRQIFHHQLPHTSVSKNRPIILRPIAHWQRFKIRQQATVPSVSAGRVTDAFYQHPNSHNNNTHTAVQHAQFHIWQSLKTRGQSSKWLHPASIQTKTIIWCCVLLVLMLHCWREKKRPPK